MYIYCSHRLMGLLSSTVFKNQIKTFNISVKLTGFYEHLVTCSIIRYSIKPDLLNASRIRYLYAKQNYFNYF